jgi:hypothetical protein
MALSCEVLSKTVGSHDVRIHLYGAMDLTRTETCREVFAALRRARDMIEASRHWSRIAKEQCRNEYIRISGLVALNLIRTCNEFEEELQRSHPRWQERKTWSRGGCYILAAGMADLIDGAEVLAVWETWDEEPDHVLAVSGEWCIEEDGVKFRRDVLEEWQAYVGGGVVLAPITEEQASEFGIPTMPSLSQRMARFLTERLNE